MHIRKSSLLPLLGVLAAGIHLAAAVVPLSAAPLRVTGLLPTGGRPAPPGARAELIPLFEEREQAMRRLTGAPVAPLATTKPGTDGIFELTAPGPGFYRVVVRIDGAQTASWELSPLLADTVLPVVALQPRIHEAKLRLVGPEGSPMAGIPVDLAPGWGSWITAGRWVSWHERAVTDSEGRLTLPDGGSRSEIDLLHPNHLGSVPVSARAEMVKVPARRPRLLEVRGLEGTPVPGALVRWKSHPVGVTGADGRIAIAIPEKGQPLTIEGPDGLYAEVTAPSLAGESPLEVRLTPAVAVAGRVVESASGRPVPDAWVWAEPFPRPLPVRSAADGRFLLRLPPRWKGTLHAAAPGTLPGEGAPLVLRDGNPSAIELKLRPAAVLAGRAVDPEGQPVAGAWIRVVSPSDAPYMSEVFQGPDTRTGPDGGFRLAGLLPDGSYELEAAHEAFARTRMTVRTPPTGRPTPAVRFVLERGLVVSGRVVDEAGKPVRGAGLSLHSREEAQPRIATSGEEGRFEIRNTRPGHFRLSVQKDGYPLLVQDDVIVPDGAAGLDLGTIQLQAAVELAGLVTDLKGHPIEGAEVRCAWLSRAPQPDGSASRLIPANQKALTNADGSFRFGALSQGGFFALYVTHPHYAESQRENLQVPLSQPLRIEMRPARTLAGRVVGPDREPVVGAKLFLETQDLGSDWLATTDADGGFRIASLASGEIDLRIEATTHRGRLLRGVRIPEAEEPVPLEVVLEKGAVLQGIVKDAQGQPVAGVTVEVRMGLDLAQSFLPEPAQSLPQVSTGPDGRFALGGLEHGTYEVTARRSLLTPAKVEVEVGPGTNEVELSLGPEGEVVGRVRTEDGTPIPGATVRMDRFQAVSAPDGSFRIRPVEPGRYRLQAIRKGFFQALPWPEVEVGGGDVREVEVRLGRADQAIVGRILGLDPAAMAELYIMASSAAGPSESVRGSLDGRGGYRIPDLGPGEWTVFALIPSGRVGGKVQLPPGLREAVFDLDFGGTVTLSGRVHKDGKPLVGARIRIRGEKGEGQALSLPDGSFRMAGFVPGTYELEVSTVVDGVVHLQKVALERDQEVVVDLEPSH